MTEHADIIARLSKLDEPAVLVFFWQIAEFTPDRLEAVQMLSDVVVERPAGWNPRGVRDEHEQFRRGMFSGRRDQCFTCRASGRRLYVHHVIEVQHGGSNTVRNLVPLCFACHQRIHPWLIEEPNQRTNGFELLRDIGARGGW